MTQLPGFQDSIRRLAFEVAGTEPDDLVVSADGTTVTTTDPSDGSTDICKTSDFLRGLAELMDAATEGA